MTLLFVSNTEALKNTKHTHTQRYWSCLLGIATVATTTAVLYLRDRTSGVLLGDQNIITRDVVKEKSKGWQEEKARRESRMEKMRKRDLIEAKRQQRIMRSSAMSNMQNEKLYDRKLNLILRLRGEKEKLETCRRDDLVRALVKILGRNDQDVLVLPLRRSNWYWTSSVSSKMKFTTDSNGIVTADIAICLTLTKDQDAKDVLRNFSSISTLSNMFENFSIVTEGIVNVSDGVGRVRLGARSGLVIERALYGTIAGCSSVVKRSNDDDDDDKECMNVTIALQFQVRDSSLELPGNMSKSEFLGFADPRKHRVSRKRRRRRNAPSGEPLRLVVDYTYEKKRYRYVCPETFPLVLPNRAATCLGDVDVVVV